MILLPIPDPGVYKAPDPGSESATLDITYLNRLVQHVTVFVWFSLGLNGGVGMFDSN
jgi:hypothetical protein